nr:putative capsid [Marmot picobirnavirus]
MTSNQIANRANEETARSNRAKQKETNRSNRANEALKTQDVITDRLNYVETGRSNRAKEKETNRANLAKEKETKRSNKAREFETTRHNVASEGLDWYDTNASLVGDVLGFFKPKTKSNFKRGTFGSKVTQNDPSWYNQNRQLVNDVANISFDLPLGTIQEGEYGAYAVSATQLLQRSTNSAASIPGIMTIQYVPGIGPSKQGIANPANMASKLIYAYVRYANSGSRNYEAPDYLLYLLAIDSLYSMIAWGQRLYGIIKNYQAENAYVGIGYEKALGVDASFRNNLANFRARLNVAIQQANRFWVPAEFPLYQRHQWMNLGLWKDYDVDRQTTQVYMFTPKLYHKYDDVNGRLIPVLFSETESGDIRTITLDYYFSVLDDMFNALFDSEDIGLMSGDTLKAFGEGRIAALGDVSENFVIYPVYSEEVLTQITSATIVDVNWETCYIGQDVNGNVLTGVSDASKEYKIMPDTGYQLKPFYIQPSLGVSVYPMKDTAYVYKLKQADMSPDDVMVATRLICLFPKLGFDNKISHVTECGTEICTKFWITHNTTDGLQNVMYNGILPETINNYGIDNSFTDKLSLYSRFDWSPRITIATAAAFGSGPQDANIALGVKDDIKDVHLKAKLSTNSISTLHTVAIQSLLGIPRIGIQSKGN